MTDPAKIAALAAGLSEAQRDAAIEGRVAECPYNHPLGTRCPNCSKWPFKKGGATAFCLAIRNYLKEQANETQ